MKATAPDLTPLDLPPGVPPDVAALAMKCPPAAPRYDGAESERWWCDHHTAMRAKYPDEKRSGLDLGHPCIQVILAHASIGDLVWNSVALYREIWEDLWEQYNAAQTENP